MKTRVPVTSIVIMIGGLLTVLTVLPVISDFLPILKINFLYSYSYITFWGLISKDTVTIRNSTIIQGWTFLGIPPFIMFLIFLILGFTVIYIVVIPTNIIVSKQNSGLLITIIGTINLVFLILIFLGDFRSPTHFGLSHPLPGYTTIGSGYWILVISAIFLVLGGIIKLIASKIAEINLLTAQKESTTFNTHIWYMFKKNITKKKSHNQLSEKTIKKIEEIIKESTAEK